MHMVEKTRHGWKKTLTGDTIGRTKQLAELNLPELVMGNIQLFFMLALLMGGSLTVL